VCRIYLGEAPGSVVGTGVRTIGAQPQARGEVRERREELRDDEGMVYQDRVNVRGGASDNFPIVAVMPAGAVFSIVAQSNGWYHARFRDGTEGWVASWLCLSNKMPEDQPQEVIVEDPTPPQQAAPAPVGTRAGQAIAWYAYSQLGKRYIWGQDNPSVGFDCSGLVLWCHKQIGVSIPRVTYDQVHAGYPVPVNMLLPGDELFFNMSSRGPEHCGVYMGDGWFIHAPGRGKVVRWQRLSERRDFCGARRLYLGR
jgi:cell wall-associated NlpC family hydrolase